MRAYILFQTSFVVSLSTISCINEFHSLVMCCVNKWLPSLGFIFGNYFHWVSLCPCDVRNSEYIYTFHLLYDFPHFTVLTTN